MENTDQPIAIHDKLIFTGAKLILFEAWHPQHPEVTGKKDTDYRDGLYVYSMYDYDLGANGKLQIYIDTGLKVMPYGEIFTRTCFEAIHPSTTRTELFDPAMVRKMVVWATVVCSRSFKEECMNRQIPFDKEIRVDEETILAITQTFVENFPVRRKNEMSNHKLMKRKGFWARNSRETWLCLIVPFLIMDEVLYKNPLFTRELNRKMFFHFVPEPVYTTLKIKCIALEKAQVRLTLFHTYYFVLCLDCALQLINSEHESRFTPALEKRKVESWSREIFKEEGAEMLDVLKPFLVKSGVRLTMENLNFEFLKFIG